MFNFVNPNDAKVNLPSTDGYLPPPAELAGGNTTTFVPALGDVILGVPAQEKGIRPARALPYELDVHAAVDTSSQTIVLTFSNTGRATAVFQVRSGNAADPVRTYTVEPGKKLTGSWSAAPSYDLSVYGPNGFVRFFKGSTGSGAAVLDVSSDSQDDDDSSLELEITNLAAAQAAVTVLDAYTGNATTRNLQHNETLEYESEAEQYYGWYDLIITVAGDPTFKYRLAGHTETGKDSFSDPALGGLVTLKG
jgi:phospholipase C